MKRTIVKRSFAKRVFALCWVCIGFLPLICQGQFTHEGESLDRVKIGRHVWMDESGRVKAEAVYDEKGVVQSYRTWDDAGLLIDDIRPDPKRKRMEFPPLALTFDPDGFGFQIIQGHARADAPKAVQGERVAIYYEGYLQDGTIFDGNYGSKKPFRYKFQMGEVVDGFDRAVEMLTVGEEGYFWLPAELAYGQMATERIPPFSDLLFKIKLVDLN
jgi:hypothetical protein